MCDEFLIAADWKKKQKNKQTNKTKDKERVLYTLQK